MFPQAKRLTRENFKDITKGKRAATRHFSISYLPSKTEKVAVIVSKKVAQKAVDRHRLKRRVLESIGTNLPKNVLLLVYTKGGSAELSFFEVKKEVSELLTNTFSV